jgi:hypothetical protein
MRIFKSVSRERRCLKFSAAVLRGVNHRLFELVEPVRRTLQFQSGFWPHYFFSESKAASFGYALNINE